MRDGYRAIEPPIPPQNLPISPLDRYKPYPFIPREMNTLECEYIQTVFCVVIKIISAQIQNNIKLIDSYAFVASALSKFPKIFNIEEEERILSSPLQPGRVLSLQRINTFFRMVQSRTVHSRQKKRATNGTNNKSPTKCCLIFNKK